jgi:hypothetical protein
VSYVPESEFRRRLRLERIESTSNLEWDEEDEEDDDDDDDEKEEEWGLNLMDECERKLVHRFLIM